MDLLAFDPGEMYFDAPLDSRAQALIAEAAEAYGDPAAEARLREALALAPGHLSVLVALYRYYFYRHRHADALAIAAVALREVAGRFGFSSAWQEVTTGDIAHAFAAHAELARFYLLALKGAGYLHLRLGLAQEGLKRLDHVAALDPKDRLGAAALAQVARGALGLTIS